MIKIKGSLGEVSQKKLTDSIYIFWHLTSSISLRKPHLCPISPFPDINNSLVFFFNFFSMLNKWTNFAVF